MESVGSDVFSEIAIDHATNPRNMGPLEDFDSCARITGPCWDTVTNSIYKRLITLTMHKDPVTYNIALQILQDEVEHEEDLQSEMEDLDTMLQSFRR